MDFLDAKFRVGIAGTLNFHLPDCREFLFREYRCFPVNLLLVPKPCWNTTLLLAVPLRASLPKFISILHRIE
mgnify:FL=1